MFWQHYENATHWNKMLYTLVYIIIADLDRAG